ncbi:hypothetical protein BX611_1231 [Lutibacter oceani]|uniref:Outer membrane protein with beta-barrel domain n=1 Tax=Lutibacter oceani TaxID=1853311 RepID=A0A3D9RX68_9FLAO|nr:hypothetical protein [Lutibacter oceani]REE81696.1 hypothetical protein BX611_1231 [Lutibacter oceani]
MKNYLLFIFSFLFSLIVSAQEPKKDNIDEFLDDILLQEDKVIDQLLESLNNFEFIYLNLNYNSNTYFSGRDIDYDQYNITPQITYVNSKGFYAGVAGNYYSEFYPKWDATIVLLGYSKHIGKSKIFKYNISYSKYFYANELDNIYSNTANLGFNAINKNKNIGTYITGSYFFGDKQSYQISSRTFVSLDLLKSNNLKIKFRPQLNIIAGKQTIELARTTSIDGIENTEYIENNVFDLINTQVNLPLQLTYKSFDIELGYNHNFPNPIGTETSLKTTGFFNISLGYLFDL